MDTGVGVSRLRRQGMGSLRATTVGAWRGCVYAMTVGGDGGSTSTGSRCVQAATTGGDEGSTSCGHKEMVSPSYDGGRRWGVWGLRQQLYEVGAYTASFPATPSLIPRTMHQRSLGGTFLEDSE